MQQHPLKPRIHIKILKTSLIFSLPFLLNIIQLSPKGEVNSGGNILCHKVSRYISSAVHQPWKGSSCFSTNQISWIKIKKELFVNKRCHLGRICLHFNGQCFGIIFSDFVTNSVITDKPNFVSFFGINFLLVQLLHLPLKFHLSKPSQNEKPYDFESCSKTVNIQGYSKLQEPIRTHENLYPLIWWILIVDIF